MKLSHLFYSLPICRTSPPSLPLSPPLPSPKAKLNTIVFIQRIWWRTKQMKIVSTQVISICVCVYIPIAYRRFLPPKPRVNNADNVNQMCVGGLPIPRYRLYFSVYRNFLSATENWRKQYAALTDSSYSRFWLVRSVVMMRRWLHFRKELYSLN